ncbi:MAG: PEP-CTERM sorting domain-containing protein [Akkermansiaceae bacterium]
MKKNKTNGLFSSSLAVTLLALPASGADHFWNVAGPADWHTPSNWDNGLIPDGGGGAHARINNGGTAVLNADIANIQDIFVGSGAGTSGTLNHTGGTTQLGGTTNGWMFVGNAGGTGTVNQSGGVQTKERLFYGRADGGTDSTGFFNLSGDGLVNNGEVHFGVDGSGAIGTGTLADNGRIQTGLFQIANGSVSVTDTASIDAAGEFWVGNGGGNTGSLSMDSGTAESDSWIAIGRDGSDGTLTLSGTATLNKVGNAEHFISLGGVGAGGGGTLNIQDNATLNSVSNIVIAENAGRFGVVNQSGGTVNVLDNILHTTFTASVEVDGSGSGLGEYNLSGGTLNAQTIDVSAGAFNMTGGILSATVFNGNLDQAGGTLSPGASPGNTLINGDWLQQAAGDFLVELNGLIAATEHDQVDVTGTIDLAGGLQISLGFNPEIGDTFTIVDNQGAGAITGTFSQGSTVSANGRDFAIDYLGGDGNDIVLTVVGIPEPSTSLLSLGALLALVGRRRRA